MMSNDLKWADQVNRSVSNANRSISILKSVFTNLNVRSFKHLYRALVRPYLEYAVGIWYPYLRKDHQTGECAKKSYQMVKRIKKLSYNGRIKNLSLDFWNGIGREEILSPLLN